MNLSLTRWFKSFGFKKKQTGFENKICCLVGYPVRDVKIFETALTHRSAFDSNETASTESNERLEFLGDAILDAVVAEYLFNSFPNNDEGFLSKKRDQIVNGKILSTFAKELKLLDLMNISSQAKRRAESDAPKICADSLEAVIGAIYIDSSFEHAKQFIYGNVISRISLAELIAMDDNFKSQLLEELQSKGSCSLSYVCLEESGPPHRREFTMQVKIGDELWGVGKGKSKKDAEQVAALETLQMMKNGIVPVCTVVKTENEMN